jgi:hypothetical protein
MRNRALLLLAAMLLASCGETGGGAHYFFVEKSNEVTLTDFRGLVFKPVCSVNGAEKKCGVIFSDFIAEQVTTPPTNPQESPSWNVYIPGFKDASILSIQMKNENSGEVKPLLSYKQNDFPYMKGNTYVPSVMELHATNPPREYTLSGYYDGDEWIERDTTISIGDTLFASKDGLLKFAVLDRAGNKASLEVDFGKLLENNDASTIESQDFGGFNSETYKDSSYTCYYWEADSGSVAFKALDINFEPLKPKPVSPFYSTDTTTVPFLRLVFPHPFYQNSNDSLVLNGGTNKRPLQVMVVDYAK